MAFAEKNDCGGLERQAHIGGFGPPAIVVRECALSKRMEERLRIAAHG